MAIAACFNLDGAPLSRDQVSWLGFRDGIVYPTKQAPESCHIAGCVFLDKYNTRPSRGMRSYHYDSPNGNLLVDGQIYTMERCPSCRTDQDVSSQAAFQFLRSLESNPVEAVQRVSGEFGLLYFNWRSLSLFAAVDHRSTSYLYHCSDANAIYISSELGHILQRPGNPFALDERFIALYLTTIYHRQSPSSFRITPYVGVEAIVPGHSLLVSQNCVKEVDYYADAAFPEEEALDDQVCVESLLGHFGEAVACRIRSAEKVCVSVSGGLDSSAILAVVARNYASIKHKVCAMTFYHDGISEFEERQWARLIARKSGIPLFEIGVHEHWILKPCSHSMALPDEPTFNILFMSLNHYLNEFYRKLGVEVCLTGHGGDQLFYGHPEYLCDLWRRRDLWRLIRNLPQTCMKRRCSLFDGLRKFCIAPARPRVNFMFENWLGARMSQFDAKELLSKPWSLSSKVHSVSQKLDSEAFYRELRNFERFHPPVEVEFRRPYLDRWLVEFALSLKPVRKMEGDRVRVLQREAWKVILPREIYERQDKGGTHEINVLGFRREWERIQRLLSSSLLVQCGYADAEKYRNGLERARQGFPSAYRTALLYLSLDLWLMGRAGHRTWD